MKKLITFISLLFSFLFISCSGSDVYLGEWKATNKEGKPFTIVFEGNDFVVTDADGKSETFGYRQHTYESNNAVVTYGIRLKKNYKEVFIHFPIPKDQSVGYIMSSSNKVLYTISRTDYIDESAIDTLINEGF